MGVVQEGAGTLWGIKRRKRRSQQVRSHERDERQMDVRKAMWIREKGWIKKEDW